MTIPRKIQPHQLVCSFCSPQRGELLSVSKIGGEPACICDVCIEERMETIIAARQSHSTFDAAIGALSAERHAAFREAHGLEPDAPQPMLEIKRGAAPVAKTMALASVQDPYPEDAR